MAKQSIALFRCVDLSICDDIVFCQFGDLMLADDDATCILMCVAFLCGVTVEDHQYLDLIFPAVNLIVSRGRRASVDCAHDRSSLEVITMFAP